jgi:hypothetical protein
MEVIYIFEDDRHICVPVHQHNDERIFVKVAENGRITIDFPGKKKDMPEAKPRTDEQKPHRRQRPGGRAC